MAGTLHGVVVRIAAESGRLLTAFGNPNRTSETMARRAEPASGEIFAVTSSSAESNHTTSEMHLMAEELRRIVSAFTMEEFYSDSSAGRVPLPTGYLGQVALAAA